MDKYFKPPFAKPTFRLSRTKTCKKFTKDRLEFDPLQGGRYSVGRGGGGADWKMCGRPKWERKWLTARNGAKMA